MFRDFDALISLLVDGHGVLERESLNIVSRDMLAEMFSVFNWEVDVKRDTTSIECLAQCLVALQSGMQLCVCVCVARGCPCP